MSESFRRDLLPVLIKTQREKNGLSAVDLEEISVKFNLPKNEIFGVSSFYSFLPTRPLGKYVIRVCKGLPCHLKDSEMIRDCLQKELGLAPGEVSRDGKFSFELTNCIGACDLSPAMLVNDTVYGHLTPEKISRLLKDYV